jgi:ribonuclease HII
MRWYGAREASTTGGRIVGLDEAGRGSVLGPLVIGAFCCDAEREPALAATGVKDSKQLTARQREEILPRLEGVGECRSVPLAPRTVDAYVDRGRLNQLELETFAALVRELRPAMAIVDACDPNAARFGRRLLALAGGPVRVVSAHRADEDFPVVSAASVVAKVARDREIARLRAETDEEIGSGYPSDPVTQRCVERHARAGGTIPPWMRRSWETVQRVKRARPASTLDRFPP